MISAPRDRSEPQRRRHHQRHIFRWFYPRALRTLGHRTGPAARLGSHAESDLHLLTGRIGIARHFAEEWDEHLEFGMGSRRSRDSGVLAETALRRVTARSSGAGHRRRVGVGPAESEVSTPEQFDFWRPSPTDRLRRCSEVLPESGGRLAGEKAEFPFCLTDARNDHPFERGPEVSQTETTEIFDLTAEDVSELSWEELTKTIVSGPSPCRGSYGGCGTTLPGTVITTRTR